MELQTILLYYFLRPWWVVPTVPQSEMIILLTQHQLFKLIKHLYREHTNTKLARARVMLNLSVPADPMPAARPWSLTSNKGDDEPPFPEVLFFEVSLGLFSDLLCVVNCSYSSLGWRFVQVWDCSLGFIVLNVNCVTIHLRTWNGIKIPLCT